MKKLMQTVLGAARRFNMADFAVFKVYMCIIGILLGMYFHEFFLSYKAIVWTLGIAAGIVVIVRLCILTNRKK